MIAKIIFVWYLWTGIIVPQGEHEGRNQYAIFFPDGKVIDFAYKVEVLEWIETDSFEYDESLED